MLSNFSFQAVDDEERKNEQTIKQKGRKKKMMIRQIASNDSAEHVSNDMSTNKITRIHSDEDTARPNKVDFSSFKYKPSCTS